MKTLLTIWTIILCFSASAQTRQEVVAAVLIGEAGGEGSKGLEAVLEVIHERAKASHTSTYRVVTKRFQFSCLNRISPKRLVQIARRHHRWSEAMNLAGLVKVQTNWTRGANHYHAITINPGWPNKVCEIGNHAFYRFQ